MAIAMNKKGARLDSSGFALANLLGRLHYTGKDKRPIQPDPKIVFAYDVSNLENGQLAK
jgi:hypothetical protein